VEFAHLETLLRAAGEVVKREDLYRDVLGRRGGAFDRSLDVHVSALRKKLGPFPGGRERIKTVRGLGYQYVLPSRPDDGAATARGRSVTLPTVALALVFSAGVRLGVRRIVSNNTRLHA
jgi:DNA-binding winged helix-turn-helix (wHTH) protein